MKQKISRQWLILLIVLSPFLSFCQKMNPSKIIGTWMFTKIEFTKPFADSSNVSHNFNGAIVTFGKDGTIQLKRKTGDDIKVMNTGTYRISEDGTTLFQNGAEGKILTLTDEELITKVENEGFVTYFKRMPDTN